MQSEGLYEVRVRVKTLAEVLKIIEALDTAGYKDVEMGPPRRPFPIEVDAKIFDAIRGRLNKIILRALYRLGAVDEEHGVEIDKIVEEIRKDPDSGGLLRYAPEGILARTVAMLSSAILAERHGWVSYVSEQTSKRFWLTDRGIEEAQHEI